MKKKSTLEKLTPFVVGTCMLTLVASCGNDDDDSSSSSQQEQQQQEGIFTGVLTPVNSQIVDGGTSGTSTGTTTGTTTGDTGTTGTTTGTTGTTTGDTGTTTGGAISPFASVGGTVTISKLADEFHAMVDATEATAATHQQHIHTGSRCPTQADDTNGDGFVDAVEAATVTGPALIPLDSDLKAQDAGGVYPSGSNYSYDESTSYEAMIADLRLPDTNTSDSLAKLGANEDLNLGTRVVEIHGVPASTTLPPTVLGMDGMSPQQSLPIACAVLSFSGASSTTGTTTGDTGTSTGTTTGDTGTTTGTTTGDTGTTTGGTGTTTGTTGTTTGTTGTTTGM